MRPCQWRRHPEPGGTLTVTDSTISGNSADFAGGGIYSDGGVLTVTGSTLGGNSADGGGGGGIYHLGGTLTVIDSTFGGNSAQMAAASINTAGTLTVTGSTFTGNSAGTGGGGGGIAHSWGTLTVTGSTLTGNSAGATGGGIASTAAARDGHRLHPRRQLGRFDGGGIGGDLYDFTANLGGR